MVDQYIGADVHCNNTELAIVGRGKAVRRFSVPTRIPAIREVLATVGGRRHLALEEGPLAGWLYRNLVEHVEELIVSDPRHNKWIAAGGDKDDRIDAAKLAVLLRGGYLQPVYHSLDPQRLRFKEWVALYHDRVQAATRSINKLRACGWRGGLRLPGRAVREAEARQAWLTSLDDADLAVRLEVLGLGYDAVAVQVRTARRQVARQARAFDVIARWRQVPGIGLIRAATLLAYLDTPWRFRKKSQLWKYCGVGLQRVTSGRDRNGRERPARLRLAWAVNRRLKDVVIGAARSAIRSHPNRFRAQYERMVADGALSSNALHTVSRTIVTVLWGMWKNGSCFEA